MALDPQALVSPQQSPDTPGENPADTGEAGNTDWPTPTGEPVFSVTLPDVFADWLERRAAAHGETPEQHAAGLLRLAWQTDTWRLTQTAGGTALA